MRVPRFLARFIRWRRYRRYLAALAADERRAGPVPAGRLAELKARARLAARVTGGAER